jgi:hypothetical protein
MGHLGAYAHDATGVRSSRVHNLGAVAALATIPLCTLRLVKPRGQAHKHEPSRLPVPG